jgi:hypothetical protein
MVTIFSVPLPLNLASLRRRRKILSRKIARRAFINRPPRRVSVTGFRQYTLWQKGPMELGMIDEDEFVVQLAGHVPMLFAGLAKYVEIHGFGEMRHH